MRVTKEVADILNGAFDIAQKEQYEYVTPELLLSLIARRPIFQEAFEACGGDVERLEDNLRAYLMQNMEPTGKVMHPEMSAGFETILITAQETADNSGKKAVELAHLVYGFYSLEESYAVYYMETQGIGQVDLMQALVEADEAAREEMRRRREDEDDDLDEDEREGDRENGRRTRIEREDDRESGAERRGRNRNAGTSDAGSSDHGDVDGNSETGNTSRKARENNARENSTAGAAQNSSADTENRRETRKNRWRRYVTCLNDTLDGVNPLIGREEELERTMQILCRKEKNNPLHIGEPGVGKTTVVYGLAKLLNEGKVPEPLKGAKIYALDLGTLLAGTQYRGDFEKRFEEIMAGISREENPIVYLDEIHNIIGAGAVGGGSFDIANMLKPYLAGGRIRFIGATTYEEYKKYFEKSKSLVRRFQNVEIREPGMADTVEILKGLKKYYEKFHGVRYGKGVIEYAVEMSSRYVKERFLPDKAIDLIDEAGAYRKMHPLEQKTQTVSKEVINEILSKTCQIPMKTVERDESEQLRDLEKHLSARVFGQDEAVRQVVNAVKFSRAGLLEEGKPLASLLFVGPTGVGKTEIARSLASELGISLLRFDMSEYGEKHSVAKLIGSPAGYVGYEEGGLLTEAVRKTPRAVLLLDEIEKAHPDIYNILLQVMDYATLTDNQGRKADFRNIILIMTSNAGASQLGKAAIGFGDRTFRKDVIEEEVKRTFQPEFRNRLSRIVVFSSMNETMAEQIAGKKLRELCERLKQKKMELSIAPEALKLLVKKGASEEFGAREMDRVINGEIKPLLVDELLFGRLKHGGEAALEVEKGAFRLRMKPRKKAIKKGKG